MGNDNWDRIIKFGSVLFWLRHIFLIVCNRFKLSSYLSSSERWQRLRMCRTTRRPCKRKTSFRKYFWFLRKCDWTNVELTLRRKRIGGSKAYIGAPWQIRRGGRARHHDRKRGRVCAKTQQHPAGGQQGQPGRPRASVSFQEDNSAKDQVSYLRVRLQRAKAYAQVDD